VSRHVHPVAPLWYRSITDFPSSHVHEENDMPVDDRSRLNLHRKLEAVLGREEADHLMAHLPPVTWNHVTTKDDLDALAASTRADVQAATIELRGEMRSMRTELRGEIQQVRTELRSEIAQVRTELRSDMQTMEASLRSDMQTMETSLRSDMQTMETSLRSDMQTMETTLRTEMQVGFATLRGDFLEGTNRHIKWLVTFAAAWTTVLVTAVRLIP